MGPLLCEECDGQGRMWNDRVNLESSIKVVLKCSALLPNWTGPITPPVSSEHPGPYYKNEVTKEITYEKPSTCQYGGLIDGAKSGWIALAYRSPHKVKHNHPRRGIEDITPLIECNGQMEAAEVQEKPGRRRRLVVLERRL